MCCVGTKNLLRDYDYLVRKFIDAGATTKENAIPYQQLGVDEQEHMFARDNFMSLLLTGDIRRHKGGYYLKNSQSPRFSHCPRAQQALNSAEPSA